MHNKEIMKKGSDTCEVQGILGKIVWTQRRKNQTNKKHSDNPEQYYCTYNPRTWKVESGVSIVQSKLVAHLKILPQTKYVLFAYQ
jgi:hypothetical protein